MRISMHSLLRLSVCGTLVSACIPDVVDSGSAVITEFYCRYRW